MPRPLLRLRISFVLFAQLLGLSLPCPGSEVAVDILANDLGQDYDAYFGCAVV